MLPPDFGTTPITGITGTKVIPVEVGFAESGGDTDQSDHTVRAGRAAAEPYPAWNCPENCPEGITINIKQLGD